MNLALPLVTVVVPAYNHEFYVTECLESIINQTYKNIELIVINDGSSDGTHSKIEEFKQKNNLSFLFLSKKNEGLIKTLNLGISLAHGKYIAFLASDDSWTPNKIERQVNIMEEYPDVGYTFSDVFFSYGCQRTNIRFSQYKPQILKLPSQHPFDIYGRLLSENIVISTSVFLRYETLISVGLFDEGLPFEDYDMWLRISKISKTFFLPDPLAYYRIHSQNFSKKNMKMIKGVNKAWSKQVSFVKQKHSIIYLFTKKMAFYFNLLKSKIRKKKIIRTLDKYCSQTASFKH